MSKCFAMIKDLKVSSYLIVCGVELHAQISNKMMYSDVLVIGPWNVADDVTQWRDKVNGQGFMVTWVSFLLYFGHINMVHICNENPPHVNESYYGPLVLRFKPLSFEADLIGKEKVCMNNKG